MQCQSLDPDYGDPAKEKYRKNTSAVRVIHIYLLINECLSFLYLLLLKQKSITYLDSFLMLLFHLMAL